MSHRHYLSLAVLPAVVAGAMFVPVSTAVASEAAQRPFTSAADEPPTDEKKAAEDKALAEKKAEAAKDGGPRELTADEKAKQDAAKRASAGEKPAPRGGVAAGEAPAADSGTTTLVGSAAGALLLAGAGTFVVRRRSAGRRQV
ncbi:hypothetical protein [Streptomyces sp. NPDC058665]|uniref:hypothetical protein n=1 Tax=Streptomyces sp. NPDC058665 TaxID=3346586 RepID=UPI00364EAA9E